MSVPFPQRCLCRAWLISALLLIAISTPRVAAADCVVLLHGLARTSGAMKKLIAPFENEGHQVVNVGYPSREKTVEQLAPLAVKDLGYSKCNPASNIHFVTHSMGGILAVSYTHLTLPTILRV